jgi:hypothetical protein
MISATSMTSTAAISVRRMLSTPAHPSAVSSALGLLEGGDLRLGQQDAVLRRLGFERLGAVLDRSQIVALSHAAHAGRRDRQQPTPLQRLRHPDLAPGRLAARRY